MSTTGKLRIRFVLFGLVASLAIAGIARGHTGATGIVKERMDLMKLLATSVKAIKAAIVAPGAPTAAGRRTIAAHSAAIERHALRMLKMFPKGSDKHPSEALPAIWQDWPGFETSARSLASTARGLGALSARADRGSLLKSFAGMARTCGECHAGFRKKKR